MKQEGLEREKDRISLEKRGYIVRRLLGQGAFSRVYCVEERATGSRAACKTSENIRLLEREEEMLRKLRHPLFPEYYGSWREGKTGFLLLEEIEGESLEELIRRGEKLAVHRIAGMGLELAEGLLYLHERQPAIVFRDVKPANIMLNGDGRVKLLDFGCACMPDTDDRTRAGTPGYSAPEQLAEDGEQTRLCDVYGLGRTLQELLWAGISQGGRERSSEGMQGFGERRDRKRLEKILAACVEKEPSARPADMRVVMAALCRLCTPSAGGGWRESGYRNGSGDRSGSQSSDFWQKGVKCEKNILKSSRKTS